MAEPATQAEPGGQAAQALPVKKVPFAHCAEEGAALQVVAPGSDCSTPVQARHTLVLASLARELVLAGHGEQLAAPANA